MIGPGKYDELAERLMKEHEADGIVLIVCKGKEGNGAAVKGTEEVMAMLPNFFHQMAESLAKDLVEARKLCECCHLRPPSVFAVFDDGVARLKAYICPVCFNGAKERVTTGRVEEVSQQEWNDFQEKAPPE